MITGYDKKGNRVELKFADSAERPETYLLTIIYKNGGGATLPVMDIEAGIKMAEDIFGKLEWEEKR